MFGIGWSELLIIAVAIIIFVDPKDLPDLMRNLAKAYKSVRDTGKEFTDIINNELDGTKKYIKDLNGEVQETFQVPQIKKPGE